MKYLKRLVLPASLLAAAVACWLLATEIGTANDSSRVASASTELVTPLGSVRRVPEVASAAAARYQVAETIADLPPDPGGVSCAAVLLDGEAIVDLRSATPLSPGYAQLLITAHAAIELLGPDYQFETRVMAPALPDGEGRVVGSIYLIGGGDPVLMSQAYANALRPRLTTRTAVEDLADMVVAAGVLAIDGGVVGIEDRYDAERALPGWPPEVLEQRVVGPLSALQLNDGFVEDAGPGASGVLAVENPALHAAGEFDDLLEARGVVIDGVSQVATAETAPALSGLVRLASVESPPLADIVAQMLAVNDASAAELIIKEVGRFDRQSGTTQAGGRSVQSVWRGFGRRLRRGAP